MNELDFKTKILSLTDRIYPMVVRMLGSRSDAQDAIQDIMVKLWERRKKVERHPNISGLVILTARNHCLDLLRKKKLPIEASSLPLAMVSTTNVQDQMDEEELQRLIRDILKELPENQQEVLILRDLDGYEYDEIAAVLKLKIEHVRVLLSRARKRVGVELKKLHYHEG